MDHSQFTEATIETFLTE